MATNSKLNGKLVKRKNKKVGLVQWFHLNQFDEVEQTLADVKKLKITHLRTNISWSEWNSPQGKEWYDWLLKTLGAQVKVLPCMLHTPPALALKPKTSAPPKNPQSYADFVDQVITGYGQYFDYIELWNEPNNRLAYDSSLDPDWTIFCTMITAAAKCCHLNGKKTVLGGMSPIDPNWLQQMFANNLMQHIDVVGIHGFPDVYDYDWEGWNIQLEKLRTILQEHNSAVELWITEAGFSTWQRNERRQVKEFINTVKAPADKVYWYSLKDLSPNAAAKTGFHIDEREYFFGMKNADGSPKLLYMLLSAAHDASALEKYEWMTQPVWGNSSDRKYTLITGGAGFVGVNLANRLLAEGKRVLIFDNLSRVGVQNNLFWLKEKHPDNLLVMIADIRDKEAVKQAVQNAEQVFHFAAQVAVTSSLVNPYHDFEVNALGTLNLLEAIRHTMHHPPVVFTSTNKVYGDLEDIGLVMNGTRYYPENMSFRQHGISEERNLDFHSPYGCTKGVAEQYILDYARTFGLKTAVFRMSCIYGPHQFGTEDQGWVAHFLIQTLKDNPITLYGDGKQVRDILYVDDLVNAFIIAQQNMDTISGKAFNIGGGVKNTISLLELIKMIGKISGKKPDILFDDWRPSDQKYYVSNFSKFKKVTGWFPKYGTVEGITSLYEWLNRNSGVSLDHRMKATPASRMAHKKLEPIDK
jgi:CDP-paratose 2-epimerase